MASKPDVWHALLMGDNCEHSGGVDSNGIRHRHTTKRQEVSCPFCRTILSAQETIKHAQHARRVAWPSKGDSE